MVEAGRAPFTFTRLVLEFEVFRNTKNLLIEVRFPNDLRGYVSQRKVKVQKGENELTIGLSSDRYSYHHYSGEKIVHFFSARSVQASKIVVSVCFRLKPSIILTLLTPFLFGFLVLMTWLYLPVAFSYQVSVTVGLMSLYVTLWFRSQHYVKTSYDNLNNLSYIALPFSWLFVTLLSYFLNKRLDAYFVLFYADSLLL